LIEKSCKNGFIIKYFKISIEIAIQSTVIIIQCITGDLVEKSCENGTELR